MYWPSIIIDGHYSTCIIKVEWIFHTLFMVCCRMLNFMFAVYEKTLWFAVLIFLVCCDCQTLWFAVTGQTQKILWYCNPNSHAWAISISCLSSHQSPGVGMREDRDWSEMAAWNSIIHICTMALQTLLSFVHFCSAFTAIPLLCKATFHHPFNLT